MIDILSGRTRGIGASALRAFLSLIELFYRSAMRMRNVFYDRRIFAVHRAPRAVICVGNLTTGGTGKTPVVRWLAEALARAGHRPAVLQRGYKAAPGERGDEQAMLDDLLNSNLAPDAPKFVVHADADRVRGARDVLAAEPKVDVLLLDDGFQHRRLGRDFDLVLIDAAEPFGFDHVLPRGLLREPIGDGLRRASAILVTRCPPGTQTAKINDAVARCAPELPIFRCDHVLGGFRAHPLGEGEAASGSDIVASANLPPDAIRGKRVFAFCGIGNPEPFVEMLRRAGAEVLDVRLFGDHHAYGGIDVDSLARAATSAGAEILVTTEKDWAKIRLLLELATVATPIWTSSLQIQFQAGDEEALLGKIERTLAGGRSSE